MPFDLDAELDRLITAGEIDPWTLVKEVLAGIEDDIDALYDVAEQTLPTYVYRHISHRRSSASRSGGAETAESTGRARATGRSAVGELIRAGEWRRELREMYPVGQGEWKRLGAMTAADCDYAARLREKQARGNMASAARLFGFRDAITRTRVKAVAELPDDTVSEILGRVA
jgi:hypothetical protein